MTAAPAGGPAGLPAPPRPVPELEADPALVRSFATRVLAVAALLDDLATFVAGAARAAGREGAWEGEAAAAYHRSIAATGAAADAWSLALRRVAGRCDAHADALASLRHRRDGLAIERATLCAALGALADRAAAAAAAGPVATAVWEADVDRWRQRARGHEADLERWRADLRAEQDAVRAVLERSTALDAVAERWAGRPDPADRALAGRPGPGASPVAVAAWWSGLNGAERLGLLAAAPAVVGNLDGVPAAARGAANAVALARDLARGALLAQAHRLGREGTRRLANAEAAQEAIDLVGAEADPVTGTPLDPVLYAYSPAAFGGDGAVAVSVGDPGEASDVAVLVPGFGTDGQSAPEQAARAVDVYDAARSLGHGVPASVLSWIGYDAPDPGDLEDAAGVLSERMATAGGARLAGLVGGLRAADPGAPAHLTVVGHSYGSTALGHAAHDHGVRADDLVLVGSPGAGAAAHHAADLGVDPRHVWVGAASRDPVARLGDDGWLDLGTLGGGGLGTDPAGDDFGAVRFRAETVDRPDDMLSLRGLAEHARYFDPDTESLHDIGEIVDGRYDAVLRAGPVTDPWYAAPQDPEWDRPPASPSTGAWGGPPREAR